MHSSARTAAETSRVADASGRGRGGQWGGQGSGQGSPCCNQRSGGIGSSPFVTGPGLLRLQAADSRDRANSFGRKGDSKLSKISRSLSWNTRKKYDDAGAAAGDASPSPTALEPQTSIESMHGMHEQASSQSLDRRSSSRSVEIDSAELAKSADTKERTWSFSRRNKVRKADDAPAPEGSVKIYLLDGTYKFFETTSAMLVGELLEQVKQRLGVQESSAFALYQVQRGTHYLLHGEAQVADIKATTDSRAKALGMRDRRTKLLLKKFLFTKHDERLITEKPFIHLFYIQAVNDVQRGNYLTKLSDAIKLAAIQYYVWYGPFDASKEQFSLPYMREAKIGEQLMPTPLVTSTSECDWEARIHLEARKISDIFAKLSQGRGISPSEAKVMYIKKVRKLPMYGTTLFHVHNSKIFPSGHFLLAANSSGVHFFHPITKEEIHSPFFFADVQRWERPREDPR